MVLVWVGLLGWKVGQILADLPAGCWLLAYSDSAILSDEYGGCRFVVGITGRNLSSAGINIS
jgi:putative AlgH/UPF0301 family transcriptional regulator